MRRKMLLTCTLLALMGACTWGTKVTSQAFATTPAGANVYYQLRGDPQRVLGELFAVDSSALLIYSDRLRRIPWERLAYADFPTLGSRYDVSVGRHPARAKLARLGLVSRFPQGLSGPLLAQVLATIKQDAVEDVP